MSAPATSLKWLCIASGAVCIGLASACGSATVPRRTATVPRGTAAAVPAAGKPCAPRTQLALAHALALARGALQRAPYTASTGAASCRFSAGSGRRSFVLTASLDTAPQAYYRLEREVIETSQMFASVRETPVPVHIPGLGLDADWFPSEHQLLTTDGTTLITITVSWPGGGRRAAGVAAVAARTYLGRLVPPPADN